MGLAYFQWEWKICAVALENSLAVPQKDNQRVTIPPSCSTPRYLPKRNANICLHRHRSIAHNSQKLETAQMPTNHLILCHSLLLLPSAFPSIRVFSSESVLHIRWPKYWSFSVSPSNEYSGLISFRMDWLDLLAVQGTLKSLLQYHSWKALILQHSAFFMVQRTCITKLKIYIPQNLAQETFLQLYL